MINAAGRNVSRDKNPNWKSGKKKKICLICGKEYFVIPSYTSSRYCSLQCVGMSQRGKLTKTINSCRNCGELFEVYSDQRRKIFCSSECHFSWRSKKFGGDRNPNYQGATIRKCEICGIEFISRNRRKYCSHKCAPERFGESAPCWKGGLTPENMKIRNSIGYVEWRNLVFERDNFTCQECGEREGKLTAHHINAFSDYPDFRMEISNGKTLCWKCHGNLHRGKPRPGKRYASGAVQI